MINAPAQSEGVAQPKGWMNNFFLQWLRHFIKFACPSKESPILVLLDGHSHKTLDVINFCREHNIHLISSPPHTTHKLQPLDRTFMKPFKNAYHEQCDMWIRANTGARITDYDIAGLVREAFIKVARMNIAVSGFKCTGIYLFDKNIFSDIDYLPCDVTNIPLAETRDQQDRNNRMKTVPKSNVPKDVPCEMTLETLDVQPSTSSATDISQNILKLSPLPNAAKKRSESRKKKSEKVKFSLHLRRISHSLKKKKMKRELKNKRKT